MGQPGGPGSDGPAPSPRGQRVEELMCRMMPVICSSQTVGGSVSSLRDTNSVAN